MDHFHYTEGSLHAEGVPLAAIADRCGTPVYVYASATLERHYRVLDEALAGLDHLICFAVKANGNRSVLATLAGLGAGADVVSLGELMRARAAGIAAGRIVFSGVGKTPEELAAALEEGIYQFNVESEAELVMLDRIARQRGRRAPVALRVNPDVRPATHRKIATGSRETKFGIPYEEAQALYRRAAAMSGVRIQGIDVHIGSQITELAPFAAAFGRITELVRQLRADGIAIATIDLGGGLGVPYAREAEAPPDPAAYGALVRKLVGDLGCRVIVEPGRLIAANAGVLVARVVLVKETRYRRFVVLDAGMNDLMRPALYDATHEIVPVAEPAAAAPVITADVVGPVCESSDVFLRDARLPPLAAGDLVAIRSAGAYGASMASAYNARDLAPEVLVRGDRWAVVRARITWRDLLAHEPLAPWLDKQGGCPAQ
ncbi:MAG: diaminopimelate decarboxylase [Alphaproteobacteria bacterium]|nr:MAG: diaminopimelate decarboxylase [Alphaproteobacteria bacterium]